MKHDVVKFELRDRMVAMRYLRVEMSLMKKRNVCSPYRLSVNMCPTTLSSGEDFERFSTPLGPP